MPAKVVITRSFGPLTNLQLVTAEDMRQIGLLAREQMLRRVGRGVDVHGQAFQPYSPGYAAAKHQGVGGGSAVNLQVSGGMLNDLTVVSAEATADKASVTLGWSK
jgi:hypothetical protein